MLSRHHVLIRADPRPIRTKLSPNRSDPSQSQPIPGRTEADPDQTEAEPIRSEPIRGRTASVGRRRRRRRKAFRRARSWLLRASLTIDFVHRRGLHAWNNTRHLIVEVQLKRSSVRLFVERRKPRCLAGYMLTMFIIAFSALTLLVGQQEGHPACKKTEWWGAGVVICPE